jgi:hypothetical protein
VLFILSLYLWTIPFQKNNLPFGEGDSAWHFSIGDHTSSSDKADFRLPYYVGAWYYGFNTILGPFAPEYPPSNHINYALMQDFGGERFVPFLIYRAIASFLGIFAVFFMVSRLFGNLPGFIAGLGLSFSIREQLTSMFGQQPTLTSLIITPVATYAWYMYLTSVYSPDNTSGDKKPYLFITIALLASQFMLHLQGLVSSAIIIAFFTIAMAIKSRKLPISKANWKSLLLASIIFIAIAAPFAAIYLGVPDATSAGFSAKNLGRLLQWGVNPDLVQGSFPPSSVLFSAEYSSKIVPFLVVGLLLLALRIFLVKNNSKELFLLSWLLGTYIMLHFDVIAGTGIPRMVRNLVLENYIFFTLIAVSIVWLPQTIAAVVKLDKRIVSGAKYALAALLVFLIFVAGYTTTKDRMSSSYAGIERITPLQAEFASDYIGKLPENAFIYDVVIPGDTGSSYRVFRYPKMRWMLAISQRYVGRERPEDSLTRIANINEVYMLFDYSDILLFESNPNFASFGQALHNTLFSIETSMFNNTEPVYDFNNMRLYKYQMVTNSSEVP